MEHRVVRVVLLVQPMLTVVHLVLSVAVTLPKAMLVRWHVMVQAVSLTVQVVLLQVMLAVVLLVKLVRLDRQECLDRLVHKALRVAQVLMDRLAQVSMAQVLLEQVA